MNPESELVEETHRQLVTLTDTDQDPVPIDRLRALVLAQAPLLSADRLQAVVAAVVSRVEGLGRLDGLLADPEVTDVLVNGPGPVWIERRGRLCRTAIELTHSEIEVLVERILAPLGRRADRSTPIAEARLPDGSRVHVVLAPVAVDGPCVAIRRFSASPFQLDSFASPQVVELLRAAVVGGANIVVSGGTGSGKTSLLNALAATIDGDSRIVTVEDAAELRIPGRHVVRFECRPDNAEGAGGIDLGQLVRSALRLRPDRLIVGEVRGAEAFDLLQALNTGHDGSMSSCHANDPLAALRRLEMLVLMGAPAVPLPAVRQLLSAAVDLVVQVVRADGEARRVHSVHEVGNVDAAANLGTTALVEGGLVVARPQRPVRRQRP